MPEHSYSITVETEDGSRSTVVVQGVNLVAALREASVRPLEDWHDDEEVLRRRRVNRLLAEFAPDSAPVSA